MLNTSPIATISILHDAKFLTRYFTQPVFVPLPDKDYRSNILKKRWMHAIMGEVIWIATYFVRNDCTRLKIYMFLDVLSTMYNMYSSFLQLQQTWMLANEVEFLCALFELFPWQDVNRSLLPWYNKIVMKVFLNLMHRVKFQYQHIHMRELEFSYFSSKGPAHSYERIILLQPLPLRIIPMRRNFPNIQE
jgi:hypothetical protein